MFTDTHCHLNAQSLYDRLPEILAQAAEKGVNGMIVPSAERKDWGKTAALSALPPIRTVAFGIHPWFAEQFNATALNELDTLLLQHPHAWVGEIGLDFHNKHNFSKAKQIQTFEAQLDLAQHRRRPVIIHSTRAIAAVTDALRRTGFTQGGIAHAFSGSIEEARQLLRHGLKIGIGSLLLNPNAKKVRHAAQTLPLSDILLETDAPFMLKNQTNTPENTAQIARIVAQLRGITLESLAKECEETLSLLLQKPTYQD